MSARKNPKYLDWVRTLRCVECGGRAEPHHFIGEFGLSGVGITAPDMFSMPLCRKHHREIHDHDEGWRTLQREYLIRTIIRGFESGRIIISDQGVAQCAT